MNSASQMLGVALGACAFGSSGCGRSDSASGPVHAPSSGAIALSASTGPLDDPAAVPSSWPYVPGPEPAFTLPLALGEVAFCLQGNDMPSTFSHSGRSYRFSLDLAVLGDRPVIVTAAAPGRVERIIRGVVPGGPDPGDGTGNMVYLDHGGGWATAYCHLADVDVESGTDVLVGDRLGTMGDTGAAGYRHLHFSLHRREDPKYRDLGESVPIHSLLAADVTESGAPMGRYFESVAITCEKARWGPRGHFYASVAGIGSEVAMDPLLADRIAQNREEQVRLVTAGDGLEAILSNAARMGPDASKQLLERAVRRDASFWVGWYALGVLSDEELHDDVAARRSFEAITAASPAEPSWLLPWTRLRLAELAVRRDNLPAARALVTGLRAPSCQAEAWSRRMETTEQSLAGTRRRP